MTLTGIYILGIIVTLMLLCKYELPMKPDDAVEYLIVSLAWPLVVLFIFFS